MNTLCLISGAASTNAALPRVVLDNYLSGLTQDRTGKLAYQQGVISGVFLWSSDSSASWAKQAAPVAADPMLNLAGKEDGSIVVQTQSSSLAPTWNESEHSFDFTPVKRGPTGIQTPASWIGNQFDKTINSGTLQQFLVGGYFFLPTKANWPAGSGGVNGIISTATSSLALGLGRIALVTNSGPLPSIWFDRGATGSTKQNLQMNDAELTNFYGKWCQLAMWQDASGFHARLSTINGGYTLQKDAALGAVNTDSLANSLMTFGLDSNAFIQSYNHRVARGFVENLQVTGRLASQVLAADLLRIKDRQKIA